MVCRDLPREWALDERISLPGEGAAGAAAERPPCRPAALAKLKAMAGAADFAQQLSAVSATRLPYTASTQDWLDNSEGTIEEGEGSELSPVLPSPSPPLGLAKAKRSRQIWANSWMLHRKNYEKKARASELSERSKEHLPTTTVARAGRAAIEVGSCCDSEQVRAELSRAERLSG